MSSAPPRMCIRCFGPVKLSPGRSPRAAYRTGSAPSSGACASALLNSRQRLKPSFWSGTLEMFVATRPGWAAMARTFAQENGPLLDLMWAPRRRQPGDPVTAAASELIGLTAALVAEAADDNSMTRVSPLRALTVATLQGLATLAATDRLSQQEVDAAIEEAVTVFTPVVAHRTSGAKR